MFKKITILCLALLMFGVTPKSHAQRGKAEIAVGYGYWSLFNFINKGQNYGVGYSESSGSFGFTFRYYATPNITAGMTVCYENIRTWGSFLTFAPEVTVKYLDTKNDRFRVRLYGAVSYGVSVFNDLNVQRGLADETGAKPWGFQATPIGVRVGRQTAFFAELGAGYKGLLHVGGCVRFPRILARHKHQENTDQSADNSSATDGANNVTAPGQ